MTLTESYFPLLVELVDSGTVIVAKTPEEMPCGVAIKVLETRYITTRPEPGWESA